MDYAIEVDFVHLICETVLHFNNKNFTNEETTFCWNRCSGIFLRFG